MKLVSTNDTPAQGKPEPEMAIPSPAVPAAPTPLPSNFAGYPKGVAEIRSDAEGDASLWTARDVLIYMLRAIDSGEMAPPENFVIVYGTNAEPRRVRFTQSGADPVRLIGMLLKVANVLAT